MKISILSAVVLAAVASAAPNANAAPSCGAPGPAGDAGTVIVPDNGYIQVDASSGGSVTVHGRLQGGDFIVHANPAGPLQSGVCASDGNGNIQNLHGTDAVDQLPL